MYYLYRHVRLDINQPFYIGIGTKKITKTTHIGQYERAFDKRQRNKYWYYVTNKTLYRVDILYEDKSIEIIKNKEVEFIKLYGRKFTKSGILTNILEGGNIKNSKIYNGKDLMILEFIIKDVLINNNYIEKSCEIFNIHKSKVKRIYLSKYKEDELKIFEISKNNKKFKNIINTFKEFNIPMNIIKNIIN